MSGELVIRDEAQFLATVDRVRELATRIATVGEAKDLADRARTAEVWARRAKLGEEKVQLAIAARMWSERRAGELLHEMRENGELRSGNPSGREGLRLADLGASEKESHRWQRLAAIPEEQFEKVLLRTRDHASSEAGIKSAGRAARDAAIREDRERAEAEARAFIAGRGESSCRVGLGDVASWRPPRFGISCVITDPPYVTADAVDLHSQLADFAVDVLPSHGALVVMTWQPLLPAVLEAMRRPQLVWRWMIAWQFATSQRTPERRARVFDGWKPILVFHKDGWADDTTYLYDVVVSRDADKAAHQWGQSIGGFRQLVRAFSKPGETVCDPFVGGGTTAVAALAEARLFVGCDIDECAVETALQRVA